MGGRASCPPHLLCAATPGLGFFHKGWPEAQDALPVAGGRDQGGAAVPAAMGWLENS